MELLGKVLSVGRKRWGLGHVLAYGALALIFAVMLMLNSYTPLWGDDWWRAVDIGNFPHIFERIKDEYMSWTGRASVLFLTFLFLLKYPGSVWLFNLVNTLVFCLLVLGAFRAAVGRYPGKHRQDFVLILLIFYAIWFLTQSFGEAVLWKTGAIAYLWVVTAAIYLLVPYVDLLGQKRCLVNTPMRLWGAPLFALFWAMALENVAVSCFLFMLFSVIGARLNGVRIPRWYWHVIAGQLLGTLCLIGAPGNFVRFAMQDDGQPVWIRMGKLAEVIWRHGTVDTFTFILIGGLLVALSLFRHRFIYKRFYLWMIIGLMFAFTMAGSTGINFGNRTAFVAEICFVVAVTNLLYLAISRLQPLYIFPLPGLLLVLAIWGADFIKTYDQYLATWHQTTRRAEIMEAYREQGVKRILLPSMTIPQVNGLRDDIVDKRYFLRDIHPDQDGNGWRNSTYGKYHGFTFANRIKKPFMVYAPELKNSQRFKPLGNVGMYEMYVRPERRGLKKYDVLYLVGNQETCRNVREVQVFPLDISDLDNKEQKARHVKIKSNPRVAWVTEKAIETRDRCVVRFKLPEWDIEKVIFSHGSLPWPHRATIDWQGIYSRDLADIKPVGRLEWKGCQLKHAKTALVDQRACTLASNIGLKGHLSWGPYVRLKQGRYRVSAHYSSKTRGSRWDLVIQRSKGAKVLGAGTLEKNRDGILRREFEIDSELHNQPLEFRITPGEAEDIKLIKLTIDRLDLDS